MLESSIILFLTIVFISIGDYAFLHLYNITNLYNISGLKSLNLVNIQRKTTQWTFLSLLEPLLHATIMK